MSKFEKARITQGDDEGQFEMVNNCRFIQTSYMPRRKKMQYEAGHEHYAN